jgi:hypothetical protein
VEMAHKNEKRHIKFENGTYIGKTAHKSGKRHISYLKQGKSEKK